MKCALFTLTLVGLAVGAPELGLDSINKALTRIVNDELQAVASCWQDTLKCSNNEIYPDCLDTEVGKTTIPGLDIDVSKFFIVDIFDMKLIGTMKLKDINFHGFSSFVMRNVSSSVTVVPLGIEFKFTLAWDGEFIFSGGYDLSGITYEKYQSLNGTKMQGKADTGMEIKLKGLSYSIVARKILGGKMDFLSITPNVGEFRVYFPEIKLGDEDLRDLVQSKFNKNFILCLVNYDKLADYAKNFFNDFLYPEPVKTRATTNPLLTKLGECIELNFPK